MTLRLTTNLFFSCVESGAPGLQLRIVSVQKIDFFCFTNSVVTSSKHYALKQANKRIFLKGYLRHDKKDLSARLQYVYQI